MLQLLGGICHVHACASTGHLPVPVHLTKVHSFSTSRCNHRDTSRCNNVVNKKPAVTHNRAFTESGTHSGINAMIRVHEPSHSHSSVRYCCHSQCVCTNRHVPPVCTGLYVNMSGQYCKLKRGSNSHQHKGSQASTAWAAVCVLKNLSWCLGRSSNQPDSRQSGEMGRQHSVSL